MARAKPADFTTPYDVVLMREEGTEVAFSHEGCDYVTFPEGATYSIRITLTVRVPRVTLPVPDDIPPGVSGTRPDLDQDLFGSPKIGKVREALKNGLARGVSETKYHRPRGGIEVNIESCAITPAPENVLGKKGRDCLLLVIENTVACAVLSCWWNVLILWRDREKRKRHE